MKKLQPMLDYATKLQAETGAMQFPLQGGQVFNQLCSIYTDFKVRLISLLWISKIWTQKIGKFFHKFFFFINLAENPENLWMFLGLCVTSEMWFLVNWCCSCFIQLHVWFWSTIISETCRMFCRGTATVSLVILKIDTL